MHILGISTINSQGSVALADKGGNLIAERNIPDSSSLSRSLVPEVSRLLADARSSWSDIGMVALTQGPGSFTNLRIGLAAVKGLIFGRNLPLVGVSSLEVLASKANVGNGIVVPLFDARKGEVYCGIYSLGDGNTKALREDFAAKPEEVALLLKDTYPDALLFGEGFDKYREIFGGFKGTSLQETSAAFHVARLGLRLGASDRKFALAYCRASEAEVHRNAAS